MSGLQGQVCRKDCRECKKFFKVSFGKEHWLTVHTCIPCFEDVTAAVVVVVVYTVEILSSLYLAEIGAQNEEKKESQQNGE